MPPGAEKSQTGFQHNSLSGHSNELPGHPAAAITGAVAVVSNLIITSRASGKTEGAIQTAVGALAKRQDTLEESDKEQWKLLSTHTKEIGYLQGKANGKAPAHH